MNKTILSAILLSIVFVMTVPLAMAEYPQDIQKEIDYKIKYKNLKFSTTISNIPNDDLQGTQKVLITMGDVFKKTLTVRDGVATGGFKFTEADLNEPVRIEIYKDVVNSDNRVIYDEYIYMPLTETYGVKDTFSKSLTSSTDKNGDNIVLPTSEVYLEVYYGYPNYLEVEVINPPNDIDDTVTLVYTANGKTRESIISTIGENQIWIKKEIAIGDTIELWVHDLAKEDDAYKIDVKMTYTITDYVTAWEALDHVVPLFWIVFTDGSEAQNYETNSACREYVVYCEPYSTIHWVFNTAFDWSLIYGDDSESTSDDADFECYDQFDETDWSMAVIFEEIPNPDNDWILLRIVCSDASNNALEQYMLFDPSGTFVNQYPTPFTLD